MQKLSPIEFLVRLAVLVAFVKTDEGECRRLTLEEQFQRFKLPCDDVLKRCVINMRHLSYGTPTPDSFDAKALFVEGQKAWEQYELVVAQESEPGDTNEQIDLGQLAGRVLADRNDSEHEMDVRAPESQLGRSFTKGLST